ncbi:YciI family protein [Streptomyces sp. NPDC056683]|uniref:YciI family protein n=1 Tax=Streptomyces sp. NPDC056683 TaxID=3345910 RepID=UPI0036B24DDB
MKQFVVTLEFPGGPPDQKVGAAQGVLLDELYDAGTLVLAGPFVDGRGGMAVLRCDSLEQVRDIYQDSPLIRSGQATFHVREWNVVRGSVQQ